MPRAIPLLALLALALSLLAAFAPDPFPRRAATRRVTGSLGAPQPKRGGTYRAPLENDVPTFDPALAADTTSLACALQLYEGLVRFQESKTQSGRLDVAPALAESWDISEDGRTYTFRLRKGVYFHPPPGSPPEWRREITSQDVRFSFERVLRPEVHSPAATTFAPIEGSEAVQAGETPHLSGLETPDAHTVVIRLKAPFSPFLSSLTMPSAFLVAREAVEAGVMDGEDGRPPAPVGSGPFYLDEYLPGERIVMVRNEDYWDQTEDEPRPYLDRLVFVIEVDEERRFRLFEEGELDHTGVPDPAYAQVANDPYFSQINQLGTYYMGFQVQTPPFDDLRVRRAFSHAIDKNAIVRFIRARRVQAARGPLPPNIPGYNAGLQSYEYNPALAARLLDEAGFPADPQTGLRQGFPAIDLDIDTDESNLRIAREVQANLMDVGLVVGIARRPWAEHLERVRGGRSPFHRLGWVADYHDADNFLYYNFFSGNIGSSNGNFYQNPRVDTLLQQAREITNPSRRLKLYNKAEQLIVQDAVWICLFYYQSSLLRRPEVHGLNLTSLGTQMIRYDTVWLDRRPVGPQPTS